MTLLDRSFYERNPALVAHNLLGKQLIRVWQGQMLGGIIVETEAYGGAADPASHAYLKKTPRNAAMFGPAGRSYVYFIYGAHFCLNVVAKEPHEAAGGVLIRALLPTHNIPLMQELRGTNKPDQLVNGPGKIGQAFRLTLADNHIDMTQEGPLSIGEGIAIPESSIQVTPRIGISKAQDTLWRFVMAPGVIRSAYSSLLRKQE